ncbi:SMP-30/gluconolactonase/LRE family protein [Microbacterium sp. B2969]|uniref:SMP-30/gluconolactonase/LRE family protein n=1 Tax=Microbacterium alkaliflavum TaxID=3248839 RepID=A0ABW7Q6E7_9MICO
MNPTEPTVATAQSYFLAEGPTWDPVRERVLWVDIMAGTVQSGVLGPDGTIAVEEVIQFPDTAGAVAVSAGGELIVAGRHRLYVRDAAGSITAGPALVEGEGRRFNDGKVDPAGRFLAGTIDKSGPSVVEKLLRIEEDGSATVIDDDLTLSNGLAWSSDGRRLFSVDTGSSRIFVRDYDAATGDTGPRRVFATLQDGFPDGITTDAEDHVWVAVWGGACVLRFSPTGDQVDRVEVPAPHVSSVAFAGPALDTLVITTATEELSEEDAARHPLSGRLFTLRPGVAGLPSHLWRGVAS